MAYIPRAVDGELTSALNYSGAVLIEGPKACGKTATATQVARTAYRLDADRSAQAAADADPTLLLRGEPPVLLDEWQVAPDLWNYVRHAVDDRSPAKGQFILTGSAVPLDDVRRHSGAGRIATLRMRPMSLWESRHSSGEISLALLMAGEPARASDGDMDVPRLVDRIVAGGWPAQVNAAVPVAARAARDYLRQIREVDISRVGTTRRDPARVGRVLGSLARNVATEAPVSRIAVDAGGGDGPLGRGTVADYLAVLERLMVVEDQPAWAPHMRSRAPLRMSPKRHFVDPSLAAAALGAGPEQLLADLNWTGFLFESLVVRDLRIYSQPIDGEVLHFRDSKGMEVDVVVQLPDGRWGAFEVKLGTGKVDEAAASLLRFADRVDTSKAGDPAVLAVITGTGLGYRRPDGVDVVPIATLGP